MSEAMAEKKREEIEALEKAETELLRETRDDKCPACGTPTANLLYINPNMIRMLGVVECTTCGCWYTPQSIRNQKLLLSKAGLTPSISTP